MEKLSAKQCRDINDHPIAFDLYWDLIEVITPVMNGQRHVIDPKFLATKDQPCGFPDTPEWHAWVAVFRECHRRMVDTKAEGQPKCFFDPPGQPGKFSPTLRKIGQMTDRFITRYRAVWLAYGQGLLREYDVTPKNSKTHAVSPAVFFASAFSPMRRDQTFVPKKFLTNIRACDRILKEEFKASKQSSPARSSES